MTPRTWAYKKASDKWIEEVNRNVYALGLQAEHARAVRIVKGEMKRVKLDKHTYGAAEQIFIIVLLARIIAALQQGRGKGGKG